MLTEPGPRYGPRKTAPYYRSVGKKQTALSVRSLRLPRRNGMFERTVFILSSDHGGIGYGHGGNSLAGNGKIPFSAFPAAVPNQDTEAADARKCIRRPPNSHCCPWVWISPTNGPPDLRKTRSRAIPIRSFVTISTRFQPAPAITPPGEGGFNPARRTILRNHQRLYSKPIRIRHHSLHNRR